MEKFDVYRLDGHALRIFLKVLETNSLTRTAEHFDLNQSTISHTLEKVRFSVGQNLFEKAGRGITPTQTAKDLAPIAKEILTHLESMPLFNAFDPATDNRDITIATNVSELIPEMKATFNRIREDLPNRHIRLLELGSRDNLEPMLDDGLADLAISVRVEKRSPLLVSETVIDDETLIFYDPEQRGPVTTVDEYFDAEHGVLDFGGTKKSSVATKLEKFNRTRKIAVGVPNVYALAQLIKGTKIITTMQRRLAGAVFKDLASAPPPFPPNRVKFDLIWHRRHQNAPRNIWLRQIVTEEFAKISAKLNA